ncbi:unnamed protein product [Trichobilharzia szidati]|nr:unnamed protein product [Trichobilharzia szidati]
MRRSRKDQKSGSWRHMEINKERLQKFKNSPCKQLHYRSNSFSAIGCRQTEQMAGSIKLFYLYEDNNCSNIINNGNNSGEKEKLSKIECGTDEIFLSFIDYPTGHVKLKNLNSWDFNIFHIRKISCNYTVREIGLQILDEYDLFRKLKLNYFMMARIFTAIEAVYHNYNPYHTALHAADVLQAVHCFISRTKLSSILNPSEIFGVLLAAAFHDADHPGVNQSYLEKTGSFLVDLHKSVSVLEKHHIKVGLCALRESGLSECLEQEDWKTFRDCFVQVILATDISYQGVYRKQFAELTKSCTVNKSGPFTQSERILLMQMALKCADISNPCRNWPICEEWAKRVCTELFCQGDRERYQWSLQPIPVMDRTKFTIQRLQIGFVRDMVKPLFTLWHEFLQSDLTMIVLQYLDENLKLWLDQMSGVEVKCPATFYRLGSLDSHSSLDLKDMQLVSSSNGESDEQGDDDELEISNEKAKEDLHQSYIASVHATNQPVENFNTQYEAVDSDDYSPPSNLQQTVFITTRVIRRHSLPETQLAIRKTFNFSLSNKPSNVVVLKSDPQTIVQTKSPTTLSFTSTNNNNNNNNNSNKDNDTNNDNGSNNLLPALSRMKIQSPALKTLITSGTPSANILQMLCEEVINNTSKCLPVSNTDVRSVQKSLRLKDSKLEQKTLDFNSEHSFLRFAALAHRRSSAPITEH